MDNSFIIKSNFKTMKLTPRLRFVNKEIPAPGDSALSIRVRILQQASMCIEDGSIEWNDVPLEME